MAYSGDGAILLPVGLRGCPPRARDRSIARSRARATNRERALAPGNLVAAIATATSIEANPLPFVLGVMAGAGSNFLTPFGYQTNLMVFGPGRYRFGDYARLGVPLLVIVVTTATLLFPMVFPFR